MNNVRNSCGKKGCRTIILTRDSRVMPIISGMSGAKYDFPEVLPLVGLSLDKELAPGRQMEKKVA